MYYREVQFVYEKLGMLWSDYLEKVPAWERTMIGIYLDIDAEKGQKELDEIERKSQQTTSKVT